VAVIAASSVVVTLGGDAGALQRLPPVPLLLRHAISTLPSLSPKPLLPPMLPLPLLLDAT